MRRNTNENVGQEAHHEAPEVLGDPSEEQVTNAEFRAAIQLSFQPITAKDDRDATVLVNPNVGTVETQVWEFYRMNP